MKTKQNAWYVNQLINEVLQICFEKRKRGLLKKAMELSILTNCKIVLAINDESDSKMLQYKSFEKDEEFTGEILELERFSNINVSSILNLIFFGQAVQQPVRTGRR